MRSIKAVQTQELGASQCSGTGTATKEFLLELHCPPQHHAQRVQLHSMDEHGALIWDLGHESTSQTNGFPRLNWKKKVLVS